MQDKVFAVYAFTKTYLVCQLCYMQVDVQHQEDLPHLLHHT